tara:strand:+ start:446 stop:640 length:195 start_codon:yes stop_codon:yes gene_type:complete
MNYVCPVCDYPELTEEPYYSFEICPQCGIEFGYEDAVASRDKNSPQRLARLQELRQKWLDSQKT